MRVKIIEIKDVEDGVGNIHKEVTFETDFEIIQLAIETEDGKAEIINYIKEQYDEEVEWQ